MDEKNIPQELKDCPQWVVWRWKKRDGKRTKPPFDPKTGRFAKSDDPTNWGTFQEALKTYGAGGYTGLGFVFSEGDPYCGIDLDKCRNPTSGKIEPWALKIIRAFDSYTEVSPSRTGLKIFIKGRLPSGGIKTKHVEIYDSGRYFTVTGQRYSNQGVIRENQEALNNLVKKLRPPERRKECPQGGENLNDRMLINKMLESQNGEKILRLLNGDWSDYPSQSEADQALCNHLAFWTGRDPEQIDQIFRASGLMREKWDKKHFGDGRTYGEATIQKAIASTSETFKGGSETRSGSSQRDSGKENPKKQGRRPRFLNVAQMTAEFGREIQWLWRDDLFPRSHPVIVGGREGSGKSSNVAQIAKEIVASNENYWILWVACEGFAGDHTDKWRKLRVPDRVVMLSDNRGIYKLRLDNYQDRKFLDESLQVLREETGGEVVAVVIDSIRGMQAMGENDSRIAGVLSEVNSIVCDRHKCCCIYIAHHKKGRTRKRIDRLSGSTGIPSSVRAVYSLEKVSDCVCRIIPDKSNALGHNSRTYRSILIEGDEGFFDICITEETDQVELTKVGKAEEFLIDLFKEAKKIRATDAYSQGANAGFSGATLRRAKLTLGIESRRDERTGPFFWVWP